MAAARQRSEPDRPLTLGDLRRAVDDINRQDLRVARVYMSSEDYSDLRRACETTPVTFVETVFVPEPPSWVGWSDSAILLHRLRVMDELLS